MSWFVLALLTGAAVAGPVAARGQPDKRHNQRVGYSSAGAVTTCRR